MSGDVLLQLRDAVSAGRPGRCLDILQKLPAAEARRLLDEPDSDHFTLLHRACASEQIDIMKIFLQFKANPNAKDSCGDTPLHWACFSGNLDAVNVLLENKADPLFSSNDGKTPLDAALEERHTHILQRLFDQPNVFEKRAVIESTILRGPLALKEGAMLVPDRLSRYRVWKTHLVILSSMVRAMFVCKSRAMAENWADAEHFNFHDILAVRWVKETRKRYLGRRINVYVQVKKSYKLRIVQEASGIDHEGDADALIADSATGARELQRVEHGSDVGDEGKPARLKALRDALGRVGGSFRRRSSGQVPPPPQSRNASPAGGKSPSMMRETTSSALRGHDADATTRSICIAFLADTKAEASRWYDALISAGVLGKSLCAVRIQTAFRKFSARNRLARLKKDQERGSKLVVRRGTSEDARFVPLDAKYTKPPPLVKQPSHASQQLTKYVVHNRAVETLAKVMPKRVRSRIERPQSTSMPQESSFTRKLRSTALALPLVEVYHNAEDESGYLLKRSTKGLVGRWKRRFVILSHVSAELQHYNPARKDYLDRVRRIPFSKMLAVRKEDKKGVALTITSPYFDASIEHASDKAAAKARRRALAKFEPVLHFLAHDEKDRDRWVQALARVLPRDNVAALKIQKVARGFLARLRIRKLKSIAHRKAIRRREEALHRIEEARQRAAAESEARGAHEELALLNQAQQDEREHRRKARAAKRQQGGDIGDWKEFTDKETGRPYYYNRFTKETVWVRPSLDEWLAVTDETTGKTYYVNQRTNESSWQRPPPASTTSKARAVWEPVVDPDSGDTYYVNQASGETRWDVPPGFDEEKKPARPAPLNVGAERVTKAVSKALETKKEGVATKRRRSPSGGAGTDKQGGGGDDDWQPFTDPASGKVFYVNQHTGAKSWTKPKDAVDARNAWVAFTDSQGRRYYNNPVTGATEWTLPPGHRLAAAAEGEEMDDSEALMRAFEAHASALLHPETVSLETVTPELLFSLLVVVRPGVVDGRCASGSEDCLLLVRGALQSLGVRVDAKADPTTLLWEILLLDLRDRVSLAKQPSLASLVEAEESLAAFERQHPSIKLERWLKRQMDENVQDLGDRLGDGAFKGSPNMMLVGLCCAMYVAEPTRAMPESAKAVTYGSKTDLTSDEATKLARHIAKQAKGISYADRPECLTSEDWRLRLGACVGLFEKFSGLPNATSEQTKSIAELSKALEQDNEERVVRAWVNAFVKVEDVLSDWKDGVLLCRLVDALSEGASSAAKQMVKRPEGSKQRLANIALALQSAQDSLGVEAKAGPLDIADGNRDMVLKYLWSLMRAWALKDLAESEQQLLTLANEKVRILAIRSMKTSSVRFSPSIIDTGASSSSATAGLEGSAPARSSLKRSSLRSSGTAQIDPAAAELSSFRDGSLRTGVFLCALLDAVRPGCINWKLVTPAHAIDVNTAAGIDACEANARLALCVAMKLALPGGVSLTWRDVVDMNSKAIVILVAQICKADAAAQD